MIHIALFITLIKQGSKAWTGVFLLQNIKESIQFKI